MVERKRKKGGFVIVLLVLMILTGITAGAMPEVKATQSSSGKARALAGYKRLLQKSKIGIRDWPSGKCRFALIYVDNNSIPELLVYSTYYGSSMGYYDLFTYKNGKTVRLNELLGTTFCYYRKKGVFGSGSWISHPQGGPGESMVYYKLSGGRISKALGRMRLDPDTGYGRPKTEYTYRYSATGNYARAKNVSSSKFHALKKKFVGSAKPINNRKIKFYQNTARNRNRYLK